MGVTSVSIQSKCMYRAADLRRSQEGGTTENNLMVTKMCGGRKRVAASMTDNIANGGPRTEKEEATKKSMTADEP